MLRYAVCLSHIYMVCVCAAMGENCASKNSTGYTISTVSMRQPRAIFRALRGNWGRHLQKVTGWYFAHTVSTSIHIAVLCRTILQDTTTVSRTQCGPLVYMQETVRPDIFSPATTTASHEREDKFRFDYVGEPILLRKNRIYNSKWPFVVSVLNTMLIMMVAYRKHPWTHQTQFAFIWKQCIT